MTYPVLLNIDPTTLHADNCPAYTPTPDDQILNTSSSEARRYNKTLDIRQERLFHNTELHKDTSLDELTGFWHTVAINQYPFKEENTLIKNHHFAYFFLPIDPSATKPLISQTINALIY